MENKLKLSTVLTDMEYTTPQCQVIQIETENVLCNSMGEGWGDGGHEEI